VKRRPLLSAFFVLVACFYCLEAALYGMLGHPLTATVCTAEAVVFATVAERLNRRGGG